MKAEGGLKPARERRYGAGRTLVLIANAKASGLSTGAKVEQASRALKARGAAVETHLTGDLDELAAAIAEAQGRVVLLGGDGTVHAVANLPGPLPELALIPAGRANNVARSLDIPLELGQSAALAVDGEARPIDAIDTRSETRSYRAVEGISVGFHARARVEYRAENSAALMSGLLVGLRTLWKFRPLSVVINSNEERETLNVGQLFAANLPLYGFGMRVAPDAEPADGKLDLVTIEAGTRRALVAMIPRARRGTHLGRPGVRTWRADRVRLDPGGASPVIADSTDLGSGPVELTVAPGALRVVTP
jgi:diacylglycerol kinase family enzyme